MDRAGDKEQKVRKRKAANKTEYTCLHCEMNVWGEPKINVLCGECEVAMHSE